MQMVRSNVDSNKAEMSLVCKGMSRIAPVLFDTLWCITPATLWDPGICNVMGATTLPCKVSTVNTHACLGFVFLLTHRDYVGGQLIPSRTPTTHLPRGVVHMETLQPSS